MEILGRQEIPDLRSEGHAFSDLDDIIKGAAGGMRNMHGTDGQDLMSAPDASTGSSHSSAEAFAEEVSTDPEISEWNGQGLA